MTATNGVMVQRSLCIHESCKRAEKTGRRKRDRSDIDKMGGIDNLWACLVPQESLRAEWCFMFSTGVLCMQVFEKAGDYEAFERVLKETLEEVPMWVCAYCLMPSHWHILLWPERDGDLARFMPDHHPRATVAGESALCGPGACLPRALQVVSGGGGRAFLGRGVVRGTQLCCGPTWERRGRAALVDLWEALS